VTSRLYAMVLTYYKLVSISKEHGVHIRKGISISVETSMYSIATAFMGRVHTEHNCCSRYRHADDVYRYIMFSS